MPLKIPMLPGCLILTIIICFMSSHHSNGEEITSPARDAIETYTAEGLQNLKGELEKEIVAADKWADCNQRWDVGLKILVCLLAVANSAFCAVIAKQSAESPAPRWMPVSTAAITTFIAVVTTFSTSQINFAARHALYRKKADTLRGLYSYLRDTTPSPSPREFNEALLKVRAWGNADSPTVQPPTLKVER